VLILRPFCSDYFSAMKISAKKILRSPTLHVYSDPTPTKPPNFHGHTMSVMPARSMLGRSCAHPTVCLWFIAFAVAYMPGCGKSNTMNPTRPFEMGGNLEDSLEQSDLKNLSENAPVTITQPASDLQLSPRQKLACTAQIMLNDKGQLPTFLQVALQRGGSLIGNITLEPLEKRGRLYMFGATIKTPSQPGKYRLIVKSSYLPPARRSGTTAATVPPETSSNGVIDQITDGPWIEVKQ